MKILKQDFLFIGKNLNISNDKLNAFWTDLEITKSTGTGLFTKYLYYFGAMIVIAAMAWFIDLGFHTFGSGGIFLIASLYACLFAFIGSKIWHKKNLRIPGGILLTLAVCMVPLAIYNLEAYFNLWQESHVRDYYTFYDRIEKKWVPIEAITMFIGATLLYFYRFPFLTVPIFFFGWLLSYDIVPFIFEETYSVNLQNWIACIFGLTLIAFGFINDREKNEDFAFWNYLFGTLSFWIVLILLFWVNEFTTFIFCLVNLLMMCFSIFAKRKILLIFGVLGVLIYLFHLFYNLFEDSFIFPFILSLIGVFVIYMGILYQRNQHQIEMFMLGLLPINFRNWICNEDGAK